MNQYCPVIIIAKTTPGTHNLRISAQAVTNRLREIGERPPYTMYALYAAFLFWPSIYMYMCDFQQCGILTSKDSDEPLQTPFKLRKCK